MKFLMPEMTFAKYYLPLIIEGNKRGIRSTIFTMRSNKYNCPARFTSSLRELSNLYSFSLEDGDISADVQGDVLFTVEGTARKRVTNTKKVISLYCSTDFTLGYDSYAGDVDHIVLGSRFVADYYKKNGTKVCHLGSPKFDVRIFKNDVVKKYSLNPSKKRVAVFYPRIRDVSACKIEEIVKIFRERDYEIVFKTRGKDPYVAGHATLSDKSLYDDSWYPSTAMELITASDVVFNFSSTVIEETTALKKPVINFHVKPFPPTFDFLYKYDFVKNITSVDQVGESIKHFENYSPSDYDEANEKLFDTKESSKSIIDMLI